MLGFRNLYLNRCQKQTCSRRVGDLYPEEQSRILELLIETVRVSENNVDIRFRTNGIEKIVEELTSQEERSNG